MDKRRFEDSGIGRAIYIGPFIASVVLTLISVGGFIASVHVMGVHQDKQDVIMDAIQKTFVEQVGINTKLSVRQETTDKRLDSIEDWRNGVSDVYITGHRKR